MISTTIWTAAIALDMAAGDPDVRWHPVRIVGRCIERLEKSLRAIGANGRVGGSCLVALTLLISSGPIVWLLHGFNNLSGDLTAFSWIFSVLVLYFSIALGSLVREGRAVRHALRQEDVSGARERVGRLCGRDVAPLNTPQLTLATVESIAENSVDGFTAPIFYAAVFGPAGAWVYRVANTLDSMVGYKNDQYRNFGWAAARFDDILNWIPAKLTAMLIALWSPVVRGRIGDSIRTMRRYAHLHASPNAGWTESAAAGALALRLGGPAFYFGHIVDKPYLGDSPRTPEPNDIRRAERLVLCAALTFAAISALVRGHS